MAGLFRISEAVSIAFHGMGLLAIRGARMSGHEISEAIGVSEAHLLKVFQRLVHAGLVHSTRGPGGGFEIADDPRTVTLFRVYEAIEGTTECGACLLGANECPFGRCIFGGETERMEREFLDYLHRVTLADLSAQDEEGTKR